MMLILAAREILYTGPLNVPGSAVVTLFDRTRRWLASIHGSNIFALSRATHSNEAMA